MKKKVLEVKGVKTSFFTHLGEVQGVRGIDFELNEGEILGIVGESGSGKSVTSLSIMNLVDHPGEIKEGQILFHQEDGKIIDFTSLSNRKMNEFRGNEIAMIFQDPMTSLNPVYSIQNQMIEVIQRHTDLNKEEAIERAKSLLEQVGIPDPDSQITDYPHQFSGGMRQRALIATAISCNPRLLIADEPTTALDVTIQAQILELLKKLQDEINMSIILITHDLGVIAEVSTHVIVMYGGMIMEKGTVNDVFYNPKHPYTVGLHSSIPKSTKKEKERLVPIEGSPPDLMDPPQGCPFSPRCPHAMQVCLEDAAPLFEVSDTQKVSCWLLHEDAPKPDEIFKGAK
ncbi:MAG: ABC transporter ATP-binding protein [Candidatus Izimaplasma sp.]|nr:ABC transporter ATP-binding protein [Candidatus Izimaplasma bacterium]